MNFQSLKVGQEIMMMIKIDRALRRVLCLFLGQLSNSLNESAI